MRKLSSLAAAAVVGAVLAAPAGAVTGGYGVAASLARAKVVAPAAHQARACHANSSASPVHKFAPVACEQPPRSSPVLPSNALGKAIASAIAAIG